MVQRNIKHEYDNKLYMLKKITLQLCVSVKKQEV